MARSNRQLTQFAVDRVGRILDCGPGFIAESDSAGNTEVCTRFAEASVKLFGEEILFLGFQADKVVTVAVRSGNFYDSKGRPSRTTRERLNGLLDLLGDRGIIPEGTRVFLSGDGCRVGKGDQSQPLGKDSPAASLLTSFKQIPDSIIAKGLL
jgi:hypothetical protein